MEFKRRYMFYKNRKQETMEIVFFKNMFRRLDAVLSVERMNENKKQEMTEIGHINCSPKARGGCENAEEFFKAGGHKQQLKRADCGRHSAVITFRKTLNVSNNHNSLGPDRENGGPKISKNGNIFTLQEAEKCVPCSLHVNLWAATTEAKVASERSPKPLWLNNNEGDKMPMLVTPYRAEPNSNQPQPLDFSVKQTSAYSRHFLHSSNSETSEDEGVGPPHRSPASSGCQLTGPLPVLATSGLGSQLARRQRQLGSGRRFKRRFACTNSCQRQAVPSKDVKLSFREACLPRAPDIDP
ncbi:hypothetical protein AAG570_006772 [Ranatra chinensis]|uniref:Uncharacterized protein n=1 Tax=Ranatra chinensis TaxID=642074 RepID=A0ABD0YVA9_9HEMI